VELLVGLSGKVWGSVRGRVSSVQSADNDLTATIQLQWDTMSPLETDASTDAAASVAAVAAAAAKKKDSGLVRVTAKQWAAMTQLRRLVLVQVGGALWWCCWLLATISLCELGVIAVT
jgi:hypothetical protein